MRGAKAAGREERVVEGVREGGERGTSISSTEGRLCTRKEAKLERSALLVR